MPAVETNSVEKEVSEKDVVSITHAARRYQAFPGSKYALPSDEQEGDLVNVRRLLLQHKTLRKIFGGNIIFAPVLDVGTGSGTWILDLATSVDTSVSMVGNFNFRVGSVLHLPADWSNTFSLVHQRLLILALQAHEWTIARQEVYRVLRPGGWIQIDESTPWYEAKYPGKPCMEKLAALFNCVARACNLYINCTDNMSTMLAQAGFVDIQTKSGIQEMGKWAGDVGVANRVNHIGVLGGIKTPVLQAGGFGYVSSEAEYDALLEGLEKEWDEIPGTEKELIIFWARKPKV
ncbi:hypothetical protein B0H16DRAFT_1856372 [Mycena metata]|uniref:Methyltransferase type 11 domain-containing protein n=1 Tax=Mycena metata TaxID=1033252 RepID=A0AAD7IM67_9AGAR|nr:hypothetical protein B0H16DRAFT_1856372 [Mycena metata]